MTAGRRRQSDRRLSRRWKSIANVNAHHTNGHHDAEDIGLTVELVVNGDGQHSLPSTGHGGTTARIPVPANGANGNSDANGHHAEPAEGQQSLFSPGRSSWPRNRPGPTDAAASPNPPPPPCSSGRWTRNRNGRKSRWAQGARPAPRPTRGAFASQSGGPSRNYGVPGTGTPRRVTD